MNVKMNKERSMSNNLNKYILNNLYLNKMNQLTTIDFKRELSKNEYGELFF